MDRTACTNCDRIRRVIREAGLDGVVATAPENVTHTSGYYSLAQRLMPERLHACVWLAEGEPVLVIPAAEQQLDTFVRDVRTFRVSGGIGVEGLELLAESLREKGLTRGRIGLDLARLPAAHLLGLTERLPEANFVDATDQFEQMRLVKTPAEVKILRRAAMATEKAIAIGFAQARPGDTEKSVVDAIDYHTEKLGAEIVGFNVMTSGKRTVLDHHRAELAPIKPGDLLRVDYGGVFDGYFSDVVRMAVVGCPCDRQRAIYSRCYTIQRRCLAALRPGVAGQELYELAVRAHAEAGLPLTQTMLGHSIGLAVHERPVLEKGDGWTLEPDVVMCVENGFTDLERGERYHLEDMAVITATGYELLSSYSDTSELYVIE